MKQRKSRDELKLEWSQQMRIPRARAAMLTVELAKTARPDSLELGGTVESGLGELHYGG